MPKIEGDEMAYSINRYKIACSFLLFLVSVLIILSVYNANGVGWDFLSHYLNGRTLASSYFYSHLNLFSRTVSLNVTLNGVNHVFNATPALIVSKGFYFDAVWEPLSPFLIGIFIALAHGAAFEIYLIFMLLLLFIASYIAAKGLDVDPLLLSSIIVGPYVISFNILYNGGEILALSLALVSIGLAARKQYKSGIFIGLMGLARYDSLIISPIAFLLGKRKDVLKAIALGILITIPWLVFNFLLLGNPLQSYLLQLAETQPQNSNGIMFVSTLYSIVRYPLALLTISIITLMYLGRNKLKKYKRPFKAIKDLIKNQKMLVLLSSLVLAIIGFSFTYNNAQGPIRLGYLVYLSMAALAAIALSTDGLSKIKINLIEGHYEIGQIIPYVIFAVSLALLLTLYSNWMQAHFNVLGSLGFKNQDFNLAIDALQSHNLGGCSIVSNAWPYTNFYNVTTYAPFYCNSTIEKMPILIFNKIGVSNYCIGSINNLTGISETIKYTNFTIYLPNNYSCVN